MTTQQHRYPSYYPPGSHWATDEAWKILDALPVDQLTDDQRYIAAGQIAGALMRVYDRGRNNLPAREQGAS